MLGRMMKAALLGGALLLGTSSPGQTVGWAHSRSDLPVSSAVKFGVLPNGMRYAIMRNPTPTGGLSLRLRIAAGSLYETDAQLGVAHFLEHMAFRGSAHVESGEALRMLERLGLSIGADANAATGFTQTVYKFDIPSLTDAKLDTALMLLRETASELSLTDASFDAERPVILSEERGSAGPGRDLATAQNGLFFRGQRAAERLPIGTAERLKTMPVAEARRFYRDYYRPERATLIVVGDIDPAAIEQKITARFGDWRNAAPAGREPDLGAPATTPAIRLLSGAGLPPRLALAWARPYDASPHDKARLRRETVERLALNVLGRRLFGLASSENSPFTTAGAGTSNALRSAKLTVLEAQIKPDSWQRALQGLVIAERQITASAGVSQADLDIAIAATRAQLQTRAASLATRPSPQLADELTLTVDTDDVFTADTYDLTLFDEMAGTITAEEVGAAARAAFAGVGPSIILSTPAPIAGGEEAVRAALAEAQKIPTSSLQVTAKAWPFTNFGAPGKVVSQKRVDDLDLTQAVFANGVRLNVKPTKLLGDQVLVQVRFGEGRLGLPKSGKPIDWSFNAWLAGGLRGISPAELQQIFAGKVHGEGAGIADDAFVVSANTRPQDFELELQLLTAYMTAPAWRPDQFDRLRTVISTALPQLETTPRGLLQRDLNRLLHSGDARWTMPTLADVQATRLEEARAVVDPALASGPMEVTIVGDITLDRAIAAAASTFGTLAKRQPATHKADRIVFPAPAAEPVTLRHSGRADQGLALVAWPATDYYADPQRARTLDLLARVISQRLFDQVRVAQGATYTTAANAEASNVFPGYGYVVAFAETPPDRIEPFYRTIDAMVADLQAKEISADELARARAPMLEQLATARRSNVYWLSRLSGSQAEPRQLDSIRTVQASIERISPADLRRAAQTDLVPARLWRLRIVPTAPDMAAVPK